MSNTTKEEKLFVDWVRQNGLFGQLDILVWERKAFIAGIAVQQKLSDDKPECLNFERLYYESRAEKEALEKKLAELDSAFRYQQGLLNCTNIAERIAAARKEGFEEGQRAAGEALTGLRVFHASYRWHGGYGAFQDYDSVVVANTSSEALGIILTEYPTTKAADWEMEEIDTSKLGSIYISERSC